MTEKDIEIHELVNKMCDYSISIKNHTDVINSSNESIYYYLEELEKCTNELKQILND